MPSLKDFRQRIASVQSTKKITSAMKMVAASKLRRAQESVAAARPYAERMERIVSHLTSNLSHQESAPRIMTGNGSKAARHMILPITANRGLCGALNSAVVRETRGFISDLVVSEQQISIFCIGRKGYLQLKKDYEKYIISNGENFNENISFAVADAIGRKIVNLFESGKFDVCTMVYNLFQSAISQVVTRKQLIPFPIQLDDERSVPSSEARALYEYEPSEEAILETLAPRNVTVQIFKALLESVASEHGARMTAMDNATRSANDMINDLTLSYNRTRQAYITKELIEIISGSEAL